MKVGLVPKRAPALIMGAAFPFDRITDPASWPTNPLEARHWGIAAITMPHYDGKLIAPWYVRIIFWTTAILINRWIVPATSVQLDFEPERANVEEPRDVV